MARFDEDALGVLMDGAMLVGLIFLVPVVILIAGAPLVLAARLVLELVQRF